eukprot:752401-Hanusia_phi.AAC.1
MGRSRLVAGLPEPAGAQANGAGSWRASDDDAGAAGSSGRLYAGTSYTVSGRRPTRNESYPRHARCSRAVRSADGMSEL